MACSDWKIHTWVLCLFVIFSAVSLVWGFTDPRDVYAITELHASLGLPLLPGWIPGGDPCGPPAWQGVECVNANITAIKLNGANLGGVLSEGLGLFASIILINLSNNHIEGTIPTSLPITLRSFFLSDNQFTGRIPDTLSSLGQLTDLSLNSNQLTGPIPDVFEPLKVLINMDLSGNSLTGGLPSSMGNLSSLTSLHLQNNQLSGLLDVLQDLPLTDLNIENNLFSGPIPEKLLNIPNFRRAGNPFNTTILPSPPASPPLSPSEAPSPQSVPGAQVHGPSVSPLPESGGDEKKNTSNKITWIALGGLLVIVVLVLGLCLSMSRCCKGKKLKEKISKGHEMGTCGTLTETHKRDQSSQNPFYQVHRGSEADSKQVDLQPAGGSQTRTALLKQGKDHNIDITGLNDTDLRPSPLPFPLLPAERIAADPTFTSLTPRGSAGKIVESVKLFTIASLQQYTNSFSQENLIGKGTLGTIYSAQLPNGKVLAVKKLNRAASAHLSDREFLELVSSISKLHHANMVELVGYCLEHGQRLLVYNYCRNGTLDETLNLDDEINKKLSWNTRMSLALQAAKALEYLHEVCQPPIVHRNFKSCNVLLEDDLTVRVSDCGLAPLMPTNSMAQVVDVLLDKDFGYMGNLEVNSSNKKGLTPVDVLVCEGGDCEVEEMLTLAAGGAITGAMSPQNSVVGVGPSQNQSGQELHQAGVTPPGGVWQDDSWPIAKNKTSNNHSSSTKKQPPPHTAGKAVMATHTPKSYGLYLIFNSLGLFASLQMMSLLILGFPLQFELTVAWFAIGVTYAACVAAITLLISSLCSSSTAPHLLQQLQVANLHTFSRFSGKCQSNVQDKNSPEMPILSKAVRDYKKGRGSAFPTHKGKC